MKKTLLIITAFMLSATFTFAQFDITFGVPDVDISTLNVGDDVIVPVLMVNRTPTGVPGSMVIGFDLFVGFDHDLLTWKGTNPNPTPGVINFHSYFTGGYNPSDWLFNDNGTEMVALWTDPTYLGGDFEDGAVLFEYVFTYEGGLDPGGSSPFTWGISKSLQGDSENKIKMVKGITSAFTDFFAVFDNVYLEDGSIFMGSAGTPGLWTGATSEDWFDGTNWDDGNVPGVAVDVDIPAGLTNYPVITATGAVTLALDVASGAKVTIAPQADLTTLGVFTNDGDFEIQTEGSNGYSGSYINIVGIAGSGNFSYTRNMLCTGTVAGSADPLGWHYLASPIDGFTSDDMYDYFVNAWDQANGSWMAYEGIDCTNPYPTTSLDALDAWSVNLNTAYECEAEYPGTGMDIEFAGAFTDMHHEGYSTAYGYGATGFQMWNMFSNPYPSGLDMNEIVWHPNMVQGAAYYDGCSGNYEYWTPALGAYSMSPGLGFFTEATGPGIFILTGSERDHGPDWFWKSEVTDLVTLEVTGNDKSDITHIRFMEDASPAFEKTGDFHKLFSNQIPQIYTTAGEDMLAVNVLPSTELVHMGFTTDVSGSYTIAAIETSDFAYIILEDNLTGDKTSLLDGPYTFDHIAGADPNRFIVHFTPLGTIENNADNIAIYSNEKNIYVNIPGQISGEIVVVNLMGQEVLRTDAVQGLNVLPVKDGKTYYIVRVVSNENAVTGKVYIK